MRITILAELKDGAKIADLWNNLGWFEKVGVEIVDIVETV